MLNVIFSTPKTYENNSIPYSYIIGQWKVWKRKYNILVSWDDSNTVGDAYIQY